MLSQLLLVPLFAWIGISISCLIVESRFESPEYRIALKFAAAWPLYLFTSKQLYYER